MKSEIFNNINKISIIGGPGTGKTTLSYNLGQDLDLPVYHLDGINYLENWVPRDEEERDRIFLEKANEDKWIIDGTYRSTLDQRMKKSDMIIFLNYSTFAKMKSIFIRYLKGKDKEKKEIPGCRDRIDFWFFQWTLLWNIRKKREIFELLNKNKDKKILVFNNRKKLNNWYKEQFKKNIKIKN